MAVHHGEGRPGRWSWANLRLDLVVFAAMLSIIFGIYRIVVPAEYLAGSAVYTIYTQAVGVILLIGAWLSERHVVPAKTLIVVAALARIAVGLFFGQIGGEAGLIVLAAELAPAALALVGGVLIGPQDPDGVP